MQNDRKRRVLKRTVCITWQGVSLVIDLIFIDSGVTVDRNIPRTDQW